MLKRPTQVSQESMIPISPATVVIYVLSMFGITVFTRLVITSANTASINTFCSINVSMVIPPFYDSGKVYELSLEFSTFLIRDKNGFYNQLHI